MKPSSSLSPDDINRYWEHAEKVIARWDTVKDLTSSNEFDSYKDEILEALEGMRKIEDFIQSQLLEWRSKKVPISGKIEELESLEKRAKNRFFLTREKERDLQNQYKPRT